MADKPEVICPTCGWKSPAKSLFGLATHTRQKHPVAMVQPIGIPTQPIDIQGEGKAKSKKKNEKKAQKKKELSAEVGRLKKELEDVSEAAEMVDEKLKEKQEKLKVVKEERDMRKIERDAVGDMWDKYQKKYGLSQEELKKVLKKGAEDKHARRILTEERARKGLPPIDFSKSKARPAGEPNPEEEEDEDEATTTALYKTGAIVDGAIVTRKDRELKHGVDSLKKQIKKGNQALRIDVARNSPMTLIATILNSNLSPMEKMEIVDNEDAFTVDIKKIKADARARASQENDVNKQRALYDKIVEDETDKAIGEVRKKVKELGKKILTKKFKAKTQSNKQLINQISQINV